MIWNINSLKIHLNSYGTVVCSAGGCARLAHSQRLAEKLELLEGVRKLKGNLKNDLSNISRNQVLDLSKLFGKCFVLASTSILFFILYHQSQFHNIFFTPLVSLWLWYSHCRVSTQSFPQRQSFIISFTICWPRKNLEEPAIWTKKAFRPQKMCGSPDRNTKREALLQNKKKGIVGKKRTSKIVMACS